MLRLRLPFPSGDSGTDKVIVKKTFLEVVEDITPRGLPATYNSDSVITSRFGRQLSGKSVVDDEAYEAVPEDADGSPYIQSKDLETEPYPDFPRSIDLVRSTASKTERPIEEVDDQEEELPVLLGGKSHVEKDKIEEGPECSSSGRSRLLISTLLSEDETHPRVGRAPPPMMPVLGAAGIYRPSLDQLLAQYVVAGVPTLPGFVPTPQPSDSTSSQPHSSQSSQPRTTVMLRNLPNNYTRAMVSTMMDKENFKGKYDFLYLPIDFRSKANLGYAFVNLVDEKQVKAFWKVFDGYTRWVLPSAKVCSVSWSGPHQGQQAHVDRYRDSPIMHSSVPDEFKPAIFAQGTGERMDFPAPSKKLRAPRRRPGHGGTDEAHRARAERARGAMPLPLSVWKKRGAILPVLVPRACCRLAARAKHSLRKCRQHTQLRRGYS
ncbi:mei2 [Symbiodinium microadriaticum]|nr:mei2 [Symbiodinium microadriaticum]